MDNLYVCVCVHAECLLHNCSSATDIIIAQAFMNIYINTHKYRLLSRQL